MTTKKMYKVFDKGLRSPFQQMPYEKGIWYACDDFDENIRNECSRGFYATDVDGIPYSIRPGRHIYEVEVKGKAVECDQYKRRYEKIKIVRKCTKTETIAEAQKIEGKLGYKLSEVIYPVHPLKGVARKPQKKDVDNLILWTSTERSFVEDSVADYMEPPVVDTIRDSVVDTMWGSMTDTICGSLGISVVYPIWDPVVYPIWSSVVDSIWDSVWGYVSGWFFNYEKEANPFQPCIDLWYRGFVPSFDGTTWRLHSGKDADVVYNTIIMTEGKIK